MDFDGTLYNHAKKGICPQAVAELHRVGGSSVESKTSDVAASSTSSSNACSPLSSSVLRVVNTGRNWLSLKKTLPVDTPVDYVISGSGAYAAKWPCGSPVFAHTLDPSAVGQLSQLFVEKLRLPFFLLAEPPHAHHCYAYWGDVHQDTGKSSAESNSNFTRRVEIHSDTTAKLSSIDQVGQLLPSLQAETEETAIAATSAGSSPRYSQFLLMLENTSEFERVKACIEGAMSGTEAKVKIIRTTSPLDQTMVWLEVLPSHVGKGASLRQLVKQLGVGTGINGNGGPAVISSEATAQHQQQFPTLSVGNDFNDLELLHWGQTAALVGDSNQDFLNMLRQSREEAHTSKVNLTESAAAADASPRLTETEISVYNLREQRHLTDAALGKSWSPLGGASTTPNGASYESSNQAISAEPRQLIITHGTSASGGVAEAIRSCFPQ